MTAPTVAIVGGGFSGAAIAYHLARSAIPARITVFEPRARLGAGLAYGDDDPAHRINVPASRMSLSPDDPLDFARWLETGARLVDDPAARFGDKAYPARAEFGRYVDAMLKPLVTLGRIDHIRDAVVDIRRSTEGWILTGAEGNRVVADIAVIAATHPRPTLPRALEPLRGDAAVILEALTPLALAVIAPHERVLIVGSGLTGADIVASLDRRGHAGQMTMISRRGLRSLGPPLAEYPSEGDFVSAPHHSATRLLRHIRCAVRKAVTEGRSWHPVLDAVREQGQDIWKKLPMDARLRIVRHLRPFWDVHRFRSAPQIEALIGARLAEGTLEHIRAHVGAATRCNDGLAVHLVDARGDLLAERVFDRIVVATGPAHGDILRSQTCLASLAHAGLIRMDETGLGLKTTRDGRAIGPSGAATPRLFIAGPLARGTFGELMGLPDVSAYSRFLAAQIQQALNRRPQTRSKPDLFQREPEITS